MNLLLGFCLFTLIVYQVSALECYNCLFGCNDEFKADGVDKVSCSGSCMKTKANGNVVRNCLPAIKKDDCEEKNDVEVCVCTSDLCNGATHGYLSTFSLITTAACVIFNVFKHIY